MRPPHASPSHRTAASIRSAALVAGALLVGSLTSAGPAAAQVGVGASTTEIVQIAAAGSLKVYWRGNGHGHGMSQYGAQGAALKGLSTAQILAFYYPGTRLATLPLSIIRVRLSGGTPYTRVIAGTTGLAVSGYGKVPTGYRQFRLAPSAGGLKLQGLTATWHTIRDGLPSRADFSSGLSWVQLLRGDGTSTRYRGRIGAVRSGSGEMTINRVSLDRYTQGVAPREMPASWEPAAVQAQAIAARTYAKSSMNAAGRGSVYDICDTTMCQVYGGMAHLDSRGNVLYRDDPPAIARNANMVLTYGGSAIFAQYSASNGGASVEGNQPYLVGKADPYDAAASGDPYLNQSGTVSVPLLARNYGLRTVTSIQVTKRDGIGPWGGRVQAAYVNGTTKSGAKAHILTTGFALGDNTQAFTDYLRLVAVPATP
jgi:stage II sporulation protein D